LVCLGIVRGAAGDIPQLWVRLAVWADLGSAWEAAYRIWRIEATICGRVIARQGRSRRTG
jgi:hypothetical protein